MDEKSQEICTAKITRGVFQVTWPQHGRKNAAATFQQKIEEMLEGWTGCLAYQDDMLLYGVTDAKLRKRYNAVMERLKSNHFTVNEEKCV